MIGPHVHMGPITIWIGCDGDDCDAGPISFSLPQCDKATPPYASLKLPAMIITLN